MNLWDRILGRKPPIDRPRSDSGRSHFQGFLDLEELNNDLRGRAGLTVYDRMYRTDPDVRRAVWMAYNPLLAGTWAVDPHGGDEATDQDRQVAEDLAWAFGIGEQNQLATPLLTPWTQHLEEALPVVIRSGFAPFEVTWTRAERDGRQLLTFRKFGLRVPRTVWKWLLDQEGELEALEQFRSTMGDYVTLPREDLLYYRVGIEGDNWEGVSMLRPCYKPWLIKDKVERLDAMGQEREAIGLPVVNPPQGHASDSALLTDLEDKLAKLRAGELAYLIMPGPSAEHVGEHGWGFDIKGLAGAGGGGKRDAQATLQYHRDAIAAAFIQEFMRLGQGGEGSKGALATADVQQDPFLMACQALANVPLREARIQARRWVTLNYGPTTPLPTFSLSLTEGDLAALQTYVGDLVNAGVLHADDPLEDFLRERGKLPPADPKAREERKAAEEEARQAELATGGKVGADEETTIERRSQKRGADGSKTETRETERRRSRPRTLDDDAVMAKGGGVASQLGPEVVGWCSRCGKRHHEDGKPDCDCKKTLSLDEEPRDWERLMPLADLAAALDQARDQAVEHTRAPVTALAAQAVKDTLAGREGPTTPPAALTDALTAIYDDLRAVGAEAVRRELDAQRAGRPATLDSFSEFPLTLADLPAGGSAKRGWMTAKAIVHAVAAAVLGQWLNGVTDPATLQQSGEDAGAAIAKSETAGQASGALAEGRDQQAQQLEAMIRGARYTSILDTNRCIVCATADDGVLRALNDPVRLARKPPHPECRSTLGGRNRCRCMEFYELDDEAPAYLDSTVTLDFDPDQPRDHRGRWIRIPHPSKLTFKSFLGGSTGARMQTDADGARYVTKKGTHPAHLLEEDAADRVYRALGHAVPDSRVHSTDHGPVKVARMLPGDARTLSKLRAEERHQAHKQLQDGFALDALLANWDVIGLAHDNVMVTGGRAYRIDNGGALRYRAQGQPKKGANPWPVELWTMREHGPGRDVFGDMPWEAVIDQARGLLKQRDTILDALPGGGQRYWARQRLQHLRQIVDMHDQGVPEHGIRARAGASSPHVLEAPPAPAWTLELHDDDEVVVLAKEWDPALHPRDKNGRFRTKIGGQGLDLLEKLIKGGHIDAPKVAKAFQYKQTKTHESAGHTSAKTKVPVSSHTLHVGGGTAQQLIDSIDEALKTKGLTGAQRATLKKARANAVQAKQAHDHVLKTEGVKGLPYKTKAASKPDAPDAPDAPEGPKVGVKFTNSAGTLYEITGIDEKQVHVKKVGEGSGVDTASVSKGSFHAAVEKGAWKVEAPAEAPAEEFAPAAPKSVAGLMVGDTFYVPSSGHSFKVAEIDDDGNVHYQNAGDGSKGHLGPDSATEMLKKGTWINKGPQPDPPAPSGTDAAVDALKAAGATVKTGKPIKKAQTLEHLPGSKSFNGGPHKIKGSLVDLQPGDIIQKNKGGHKLEIIGDHPSSSHHWQVKTSTGKTKTIQKSMWIASVVKADGSEVKLKNPDAAPAAPAAPAKPTPAALKASLINNNGGQKFSELPRGTAFETLDGKLAVLDPDTPAYQGYITAWTGNGTKVEVPESVAPTKVNVPGDKSKADANLELMHAAAPAAPSAGGGGVSHAPKPKGKSKTSVHDAWKGLPNGQESKTKVAGWQAGTQAKLTGEQKSALQGYTNGTYSDINGALRNESLDVYKLKQIQALDSVFDVIPGIPEDIITHRGTHEGALTGSIQPGQVIFDKGYMSTSPTKPWSKDVILHIRLKAGSKALWGPTTGADVTAGEDEIILRRSTMMQVLEVEEIGGKKHIYVEAYA